MLPRSSGDVETVLTSPNAVPFKSPPSLSVTVGGDLFYTVYYVTSSWIIKYVTTSNKIYEKRLFPSSKKGRPLIAIALAQCPNNLRKET